MKTNLLEFVSQIPKSDLHVHLDGSVRMNTIIELSKKQGIKLPSYTVEGLNELVFKDKYANLVEYLAGFGYVVPIMQTPENLERIGYEFAMDNINEGVCYVEARFAPQLHVNDDQDMDKVLLSVNSGFERAQSEYNPRKEVQSGQVPEFKYGIIACAMRSFFEGMSPFYDMFLKSHRHSKLNNVYAMASRELAFACVNTRDKYGIPIVALDLAGAEAGNPPSRYKDAYHFAHQNFMNLTVHAGEAYGPESILEAISELYPERIGHGFHLFSHGEILDPLILADKERIMKKLVNYIGDRKIAIEVCLTSNLQTIPSIKDIKNHSLGKMIEVGLTTCICTDNRTVSKTTATKELMLAIENFDLDESAIKKLVLDGFRNSFYCGSYAEKTRYIDKVVKRYDELMV